MLISNFTIWILKVFKYYSQNEEQKINVYSLETRKPVDMQVTLFHADCNEAKKGSRLKRSQSAENKKLQRQSLAQQLFQTKLLVIFTKQTSWCHLFICFLLS